MFDRQCCDLSVRNEISTTACGSEYALQGCRVSFRRYRNPNSRAREPGFDTFPGGFHAHRLSAVNSGIGNNTQERGEALPGKTDPGSLCDLVIQPSCCLVVPRAGRRGINQNIRVHQDHLWSSPSITARTSEMLSRFGSKQGPTSKILVWKGVRIAGDFDISANPARRALFTASLKLALFFSCNC